MKQPRLFLAVIFFAFSFQAFAQDPTWVAPESYKLQFENDRVKILRVHYRARSTVPVHDHSRFPAAYVYLNDSAPIRFRHTDWEHPVLTRPAVKAGSFRLSPTRFDNETHSVENPNDTPSHFLRIEIKTVAPNRASLRGRFAPEPVSATNGLNKVVFDNAQLRVTRLASARVGRLTVKADAAAPALLVALSSGKIDSAPVETGHTIWLSPGEQQTIESAVQNGPPVELLRFDLKTKPLNKSGKQQSVREFVIY